MAFEGFRLIRLNPTAVARSPAGAVIFCGICEGKNKQILISNERSSIEENRELNHKGNKNIEIVIFELFVLTIRNSNRD
jgi:hypothetical protein